VIGTRILRLAADLDAVFFVRQQLFDSVGRTVGLGSIRRPAEVSCDRRELL
jgi:hypothetical protein